MKQQSILVHRDYLFHYPDLIAQLQPDQTHTYVNKGKTYLYSTKHIKKDDNVLK